MRIGIFGGSFDPIHDGHIAIARAALSSGAVDEVWLMVSPENPLKAGLRKAPFADRLAMARLALAAGGEKPGSAAPCDDSKPGDALAGRIPVVAAKGGIKVSDFEEHMPKPSYTISTLRALRGAYPDCNFRLIIGGDNLERFASWRSPQEILSDYGLIVYPRPGISEEQVSKTLSEFVVKESDCIILRDVEMMDVSSTRIRTAIRKGEIPRGVAPEVVNYIKEKGIYGES